jgi:hypothetical protein
MKKLLLALAALLGFTVLAPTTAEAGGCRTRVTYDSCGYAVHSEYRFVGRDCHGCPIYRWVVVSRCAPRHHYGHGHGGHYHGGYGHGGHSRRGGHVYFSRR